MTWPPTPAEVASFGGVDSVGTSLTKATASAVAFVERVRSGLVTGQGPVEFDASDDVVVGTMMLALNDHRGGSGEVDLYDRDRIDELLGIRKYAPFGFGAPSCEEEAS